MKGEINEEWLRRLWPKRRREKETIVDQGRFRSWKHGELGIRVDIDLCIVAKLEGREDHRSVHADFRVLWKIGRKSDVGIFIEEGIVMFECIFKLCFLLSANNGNKN
jgi:hypothetical protein